MILPAGSLAHLLSVLALVVLVAHLAGRAFVRFRQPRVIGEIVGGLLLGPTVLGLVWPQAEHWLSPASGPVAVGLAVLNQLGLLLLMFLAGAHLRVRADGRERRIAVSVAVSGLALPFLAGAFAVSALGYRSFAGPYGTRLSLMLTFGIAAAVAAIPIISRIMMDLGVLNTPFARVVLIVAVVEDLVLYLILAVVLGAAKAEAAGATHGELAGEIARYVVASLVLFAVCLRWGPGFFRWLADQRWNVVERFNPVAFRLVFLCLAVGVAGGLGLNPIFGALLAGYCAARGDALIADPGREAATVPVWDTVHRISLDFLVPVYFAFVGIQLDLVHEFDVVFFALFTAAACLVKGASVFAGARLARADRRMATRVAVALNARGTPGVTLASITFAAGVINSRFFATLVMMSIFTCQLAGIALDRSIRRERRELAEPPPPVPVPQSEDAA